MSAWGDTAVCRLYARGMRESVHPKRPSTRTCCCFSPSKTLLIPGKDYTSIAFVNVSAAVS
jgi:hypothetical protein